MSRRDKPPRAARGPEREGRPQAEQSARRAEDQSSGNGASGGRGTGREREEQRERDAPSAEASESQSANLIQAAPGLVRIAAVAWWKTAEWTVTSSLRAGERLARAAMNGESPGELFEVTGAELREYVRRLLEIVDIESGGDDKDTPGTKQAGEAHTNGDLLSLRERGAELLRRSADVDDPEETHPAYQRILEELAPDEGRILRLLATRGAQPSVDVRTARPFDIGSELVAPGLNMIGAEAGVKHGERVQAYLNNLERLGLIWFSREALDEQSPYQVLEAQPEVAEAMEKAGRAKTIRRSIHLTPFGEDFCETVLPLHTDELEALPAEVAPPPERGEKPSDQEDGEED